MEEYKAVVVTDEKKIKEIKKALLSRESSIADIKPSAPDKLPENAKKIWFSQNKAQKSTNIKIYRSGYGTAHR